jgi:hypothetical protein
MSLMDFWRQRLGPSEPSPELPVESGVVATQLVLGALHMGGPSEPAVKARALLRDEDFVAEVSNEVGDPADGESEDEYVDRATELVRRRLRELVGLD